MWKVLVILAVVLLLFPLVSAQQPGQGQVPPSFFQGILNSLNDMIDIFRDLLVEVEEISDKNSTININLPDEECDFENVSERISFQGFYLGVSSNLLLMANGEAAFVVPSNNKYSEVEFLRFGITATKPRSCSGNLGNFSVNGINCGFFNPPDLNVRFYDFTDSCLSALKEGINNYSFSTISSPPTGCIFVNDILVDMRIKPANC